MSFEVDGEMMNFRGTLTLCSADNPAACVLGGYKTLHSAARKCRTCMAVDVDMQAKVCSFYVCMQFVNNTGNSQGLKAWVKELSLPNMKHHM